MVTGNSPSTISLYQVTTDKFRRWDRYLKSWITLRKCMWVPGFWEDDVLQTRKRCDLGL